jgi:aminoglycoside 6'-N-acetyltransferase
MITDSELLIRKMIADDFPFMAKWLTDEKVLEFYEGRDNPHDLKKVQKVYGPKVEGNHYVTPCIIEVNETPIGYVQYYMLEEDGYESYGYSTDEVIYGIDQFIGETGYWGKGYGTRMVQAVVEYLFNVKKADRVVLDPQTWNERAIRCYEKCGFKKVKLLSQNEMYEGKLRDCYLMEKVR